MVKKITFWARVVQISFLILIFSYKVLDKYFVYRYVNGQLVTTKFNDSFLGLFLAAIVLISVIIVSEGAVKLVVCFAKLIKNKKEY